MKTLPVNLRFVVLAVIVIVAVVSCCNLNFPSIPNILSYSVEIGGKQKSRRYVEWKSEAEFDKALAQVCSHRGTYCIYVKRHDSDPDPTHPYQPHNPPSNCTDCRQRKIKTDQVTRSKAADNIASGESALNDPHVTQVIRSPYASDISAVLETLKQ